MKPAITPDKRPTHEADHEPPPSSKKEERSPTPSFQFHLTKDGLKLWINGLIPREALVALAMVLLFALLAILFCKL